MVGKELSYIKVLHFLIHDIRCCLDLQYVEKIFPLPLLEPIPGSPIYLAGLMNLHGKCIPVVDLRICAGLTCDEPYALRIPILLCSDGTHRLGLIVDRMIGLGEIDKNKIEIHEEFTRSHSLFYGAVASNNGVSLLMDVASLFALKLTEEMDQISADHD